MSRFSFSRHAVRYFSIMAFPLMAVAFFFNGVTPAPAQAISRDLSLKELETKLGNPKSGLCEFTGSMRSMLISGRIEEAEAKVDRKSLMRRAVSGVQMEGISTVQDLFRESTERAWDSRGLLGDYAGTNFRFLRPLELKGRAGLLFRSSNSGGMLNYALFTVRPEGADYRITDIMVVGLNEFVSETLNRTYRHVLAGFDTERAGQIPGVNQEYVTHINEVAELNRDLNAGSYEAVLTKTAAMPAALRSERSVLIMRMEAADKFSTSARASIYKEWLEAFPDEQELPLKLADYYISTRQWNNAERVLEGLRSRIGDDLRLKLQMGEVACGRRTDRDWVTEAKLSTSK